MAGPVEGSAVEQTFPPLPLEEWEDSKETLHRYAQVVGKIRLRYAPFMNHWWHVTLYVSPRGLATGPIPYGHTTFEISFDLIDNRLAVSTSEGSGFSFALDDLPVAGFYGRLVEGLGALGIHVSINTNPFDLDDEHPLDENVFHHACDRDYVGRYARVLGEVDQVFKEFAGRFNGKCVLPTRHPRPRNSHAHRYNSAGRLCPDHIRKFEYELRRVGNEESS